MRNINSKFSCVIKINGINAYENRYMTGNNTFTLLLTINHAVLSVWNFYTFQGDFIRRIKD